MVAVVLEVVVGVVLVVVGVLVVVWLVVVGVDDVVELLDVVVLLDVAVVVWQSFAASCATVEAPCSRFRVSVALTEGGRLTTALLKVVTAFAAAAHCPVLTALESWSSEAFRSPAWLDGEQARAAATGG